jgi:hypothetical protein
MVRKTPRTAQWPQLDPTQQNDLLSDLTSTIVGALPSGWRELAIDYRVVGRNIDPAVGLLAPDDTYQLWHPPDEAWRMIQRLRGGMYRDGEGAWFSARFIIQPPARFSVQYNWHHEPTFRRYPAPEEFVVEQKRFPRGDSYMPEWFRERLTGA